MAVGEQLPAPFAADLLDAARDAFTQGLQLAATISAAVVIAAAFLAVVLLLRAEEGPDPAPQPDPTPGGAVAGEACGDIALGPAVSGKAS